MCSCTRHFGRRCLECLLLTVSFLAVGCKSSDNEGKPSTEGRGVAGEAVYVILEGPWAIAPDPDPKNKDGILAIAPNVVDHGLLYVQSYTGFALLPGEYQFQIPNIASAGTKSFSGLNETVPASSLLAAENNTGFKRYAVHFPKPNGVGAASGTYARVDESGNLPVDPASINEASYTTQISLEYSVANWQTISVTGSTDPIPTALPGISVPLSITQAATVGAPHMIRVGTEPSQDELGSCSNQSKGAFHALVGLFQLKKTIDFRTYDKGCWACDPQGASPKPCPSIQVVQDLKNVGDLVKTAKMSRARQEAERAIQEAENLVSQKSARTGTQRDLLQKVAGIRGYLEELKSKDADFAGKYEVAAQKVNDIVSITSLPAKDCKSPLLNLSVN